LKEEKKRSILKEILDWVLLILIAILITSIVHSQLFALTEVNMQSMMDTLEPTDRLVMSKLAYASSEPQRGDIIIFLNSEPVNGIFGRFSIYFSDISLKFKKDYRNNRLIKRVIAIPGDTVEIIDNVLYVNDIAQEEPYARIDPDENIVVNGQMDKITIPPGKLFVLGDNRRWSIDSRNYGVIDRSWVEGKAVFRIAPFSKFGKIND
jgi:signal peptidase I